MGLFRAIFGFILACLAAAATLVLFVYTPAELASLPSDIGSDRLTEAGFFTLVVAPHVMLFSALPALICILFAEGRSIGTWTFYVGLGIALAVLGFLAQHFSEAPGQATILQNYALIAFLLAGVVGGLVYWFFSGRFAAPRVRAPLVETRPSSPAPAGQ
jgi:hypothetical protein